MFTWNFQYISKKRLSETFRQLMLNPQKGDIIIRIHTAIHLEEEAVDLAKYIAGLVPGAHIFGTSTSAVINWGKLRQNQCVVSVTQMSSGHIRTEMIPTFDKNDVPVPPELLCEQVRDAVTDSNTELLLTFLTVPYLDVYSFVEKCNDVMPGVKMIGGIANLSEYISNKYHNTGFVFNENGWMSKGMLVASFSGENLECYASCATGAQAIGSTAEITDTFGTRILSIDGEDAAEHFLRGIGEKVRKRPELANLFPYVYADTQEIPIVFRFTGETSIREQFDEAEPCNAAFYTAHPAIDRDAKQAVINLNHNVRKGKHIRRAFIYDKKIVADNRDMFRHIENFEKAETLFGYSCMSRATFYASCVKWELSVYEDTNICGCITDGEIVHINGKNCYANCSFTVAAIGEEEAVQTFNPYAFSYTDSLADDNQELLDYLCEIEMEFSQSDDSAVAAELRSFVRDCERNLLYSESDDIPNAAALNMDIQAKGFDRVCMINVFDISGMETVFPKEMINLTYQNYILNCLRFAKQKGYAIYIINQWHIAVAAPSYIVSLPEFAGDMEILQRQLFEATEEYIALVPMFCVLDDCTAENLMPAYYAARVIMMQKNVQFLVRNARVDQLDEDSIRERFHMVNVINYAITHDKVIPYYQGIYDNRENKIHHYESLMRLEDEKGQIYYPGSFLPVARSYGLLYDSMSRIMVEKVFRRFRDMENQSVSINLSIRDIKNHEMTEYIHEFLSTVKHPENFVFEILENEDIDDYDEMIRFVDTIHDLGAQISIDDFGSGFSNLQHIASINCDFLKIDGSIVRKCCVDEQSANLIALISGWKRLSNQNIRIIAEFVENKEIQDLLLDFKIDFSQGYYFSKPSPDIQE